MYWECSTHAEEKTSLPRFSRETWSHFVDSLECERIVKMAIDECGMNSGTWDMCPVAGTCVYSNDILRSIILGQFLA